MESCPGSHYSFYPTLLIVIHFAKIMFSQMLILVCDIFLLLKTYPHKSKVGEQKGEQIPSPQFGSPAFKTYSCGNKEGIRNVTF